MVTKVLNVVLVHSYGLAQRLLIEGECDNVFTSDGLVYALSYGKAYALDPDEGVPEVASSLLFQAIAPCDGGACGVDEDGKYYADITSPSFIEADGMPAVNAIADESQTVKALFDISQVGICAEDGLYELSRTNITLKEVPKAVPGSGYTLMKRSAGEVTAVLTDRIMSVLSQETVKSAPFTIKDYAVAGGHYYVKDPDGVWCGESASGFAEIDVLKLASGVRTIAYDYFSDVNSPLAVQNNAILKMMPAKVNTLIAQPGGRKRVSYDGAAGQIVAHSRGYTDNVYVVIKSGDSKAIYEYSYGSNTIRKQTYATAALASATDVSYTSGSDFTDVKFAQDDADSGKIFAVIGSGTAVCEDGSRFVSYDDTALQKLVLARGGSVNYFSYSDGVYGVGTTSGLHQSTGNADTVQFRCVAQKDYELRRFQKVTPRRYLIGSGYGLFTLQNSGADLTDAVFKNSSANADVAALTSFNLNGVDDTFAYAEGAQVYASYNARKWYEYMKLPSQVSRINDLIARNKHLYYFATDVGLYRTNYAYALSNDIQKFTEEDAKRIYDGVEDDLVSDMQQSIDEHERDWHGDDTDVATYLNSNCLSVNFDGATAAGWGSVSHDQTSSVMTVSNDMAYEVFFGDESSGDLHVSVSNFISASGSVACSYVLKRYVSGMSELYVYVPTTCTQYVAHAYGTPNCKYYGREVERGGRFKQYGEQFEKFKTDLDLQYTSFTLFVDSAFATLSAVVGVEACPNSLPLNIYKDSKYQEAEGGASQLFHTLIKPTVVMSDVRRLSADMDGEYAIEFACFGSDAQAVKLQFFDSAAGVGGETFKIEFRPNGADGSMAPQRVTIGQSRQLRPCAFSWDGDVQKAFSGWSLEADPEDNSTPQFADRQAVSAADIEKITGEAVTNGKTVRMYAVWSTYKFGASDTRFLMKSSQKEFYIDSADVDQSTELGGKVIIDYGD